MPMMAEVASSHWTQNQAGWHTDPKKQGYEIVNSV